MATADHRGELKPRLSWLGLVGFGLVLALLAVALVQARQFALLRHAVQTGDDYSVLTIFQAETEYLRLREQSWRLRLDGLTGAGMAKLREAEARERSALELIDRFRST